MQLPAVTVFLVNSEQWHTHRHSLLIHTSMPIYATIPYTPLFGLSAIGAVAWWRKKRGKCATLLNFDLNLGVPFVVQVWMPDTFFRNEKEGKFHDIIQPNLYVRVFPNGDVLYSIRCQLSILAPMHWFTCLIRSGPMAVAPEVPIISRHRTIQTQLQSLSYSTQTVIGETYFSMIPKLRSNSMFT